MSTQAVVVTGASTGIGAATVELLAERGFTVFAGVRSEADFARVAARAPRIRPLYLDVTDADAVARAAHDVAQSGLALRGVVANAGIAAGGPLEFLPVSELRRVLETNVIGAVAVTQAFLPQLRTTHGRVVLVGSISGRVAFPFMGPYAASKFALRAISDALRLELTPAGIAVALIEPGSVKTPIWAKGRASRDRLMTMLGPTALEYYGEKIDAIIRATEHEERTGMPAERVSAAILHALTARRPRSRYLLGPQARAAGVIALFPSAVRDRVFGSTLK